MEFEHVQTIMVLRRKNGIKAYKILDIRDGHLVFQLWLNSDEQGRITLSVPEEYSVGEYIDLQVVRTSKTSYIVKLIGRTPQMFVPADGRNIAI